MSSVSTTSVDVTLTVAGVERELTATVRYEWLEAERGSRERGGRQLEPDYKAGAAILGVRVSGLEVAHLFNRAQLDAIAAEIAEGGA